MRRWDDLNLVEQGAVLQHLNCLRIDDYPVLDYIWAIAFHKLKVWPTQDLTFFVPFNLLAVQEKLKQYEGVEEPKS